VARIQFFTLDTEFSSGVDQSRRDQDRERPLINPANASALLQSSPTVFWTLVPYGRIASTALIGEACRSRPEHPHRIIHDKAPSVTALRDRPKPRRHAPEFSDRGGHPGHAARMAIIGPRCKGTTTGRLPWHAVTSWLLILYVPPSHAIHRAHATEAPHQ
jgi:hypothetical protein